MEVSYALVIDNFFKIRGNKLYACKNRGNAKSEILEALGLQEDAISNYWVIPVDSRIGEILMKKSIEKIVLDE